MAILFDMDGVLIDTMTHHTDSFVRVCTALGYSESEARQASSTSNSLKGLYANLQQIRPLGKTFPEFVDITLEDVFRAIEEGGGIQRDPELLPFLHHLREQGIEVAIGTSAVHKSAVRKLAMMELHNEFGIIVTADDVPQHKPFPDVYLKAAELLGIDPSRCIVIDDAAHGILAGKRAGAKTIGFTKYLQDKTVLPEADLLADSFAELTYDRLQRLVNS